MPLSAPIKTQLNAMLHCIQIFTNTFEVTMQVKAGHTTWENYITQTTCTCTNKACFESPHYMASIPI